jgi:DNA-binding GntR family transcriptional regulator
MARAWSELRGSLGGSRRQTAHEYVRDILRHAILNGDLSGGARLVQAEVAAELGVSTTPVREAFRDLAAEGLIRLDAHRGAIVHEFDMAELQEIYELRQALEPMCMRRVVDRITEEELARARSLQDGMDECDDDVADWVTLNRDFHALITEASRSPRLIAILQSLRDSAAMYVGMGLRSVPKQRSVGNAEHHRLLEALEARDADAAAAAILEHMSGTMSVLGDAETDAT